MSWFSEREKKKNSKNKCLGREHLEHLREMVCWIWNYLLLYEIGLNAFVGKNINIVSSNEFIYC